MNEGSSGLCAYRSEPRQGEDRKVGQSISSGKKTGWKDAAREVEEQALEKFEE